MASVFLCLGGPVSIGVWTFRGRELVPDRFACSVGIMEIKPLGDSALLVVAGETCEVGIMAKVVAWSAKLRSQMPTGVTEVVSACASLAVYYDPLVLSGQPGVSAYGRVAIWVEQVLTGKVRAAKGVVGRRIEVPVVYGGEFGPDLNKVAKGAGLTVDEVVAAHTKPVYRVAAVGFAAGFPYLLGLSEELHTPRRATPRTLVPGGSVGIGGSQTGVYPADSPGGWQLIGRTALRLFTATAEPPALMAAGDEVVFKALDKWPKSSAVAGAVPSVVPLRARGKGRAGRLQVVRPGGLTTVQDLGRSGWRVHGVSPGGAMDRVSARVANIMAGNAESAAVLEFTHTGPVLQFDAEAKLVLTGAQVTGVPWNRLFSVAAGEVLDCSRLSGGARSYLAVAGGFDAPVVLGGRGVALRGGFGGADGSTGRGLLAGDELTWGRLARSGPPPGNWTAGVRTLPPGKDGLDVRVLPGAHADWFTEEARNTLKSSAYKVTAKGDRMGVRLSGTSLDLNRKTEMLSQPLAAGAIQVPPDGQPIVLLADCQTVGGYPQVAQVIAVDLDRLCQAKPGVMVRFVPVTLAEAEQALWKREKELGWLRAGLGLRIGKPE